MRSKILSVCIVAVSLGCGCVHIANAAEPAQSDRMQRQLDAAQARLEQAAREVAQLSSQLAADRLPETAMQLRRNAHRAMLGIAIGPEEKNAAGAQVISVSPGGPAATAGIEAGDVITNINGHSLRGDAEMRPTDKLLETLEKLAPGDTAKVVYTRRGKSVTTQVKLARVPEHFPVGAIHSERGHNERWHMDADRRDVDKLREDILMARMFDLDAFGALELVPLTPKLGRYFGTDKGLLVVRAPRNPHIKLEDGDVLVDIDGRVPTSPGHAYRILGSYQPGEKMTLNVLRQRKKMAIDLTLPQRSPRVMPSWPSRPPQAPQPPQVPGPPAPPAPHTPNAPPVPPEA